MGRLLNILLRIMTPFIGRLLQKFIKRIEDTEDTVFLTIHDDLFDNNQLPLKIKQIKIGKSSKICGINISSIFIDSSYYISTQSANRNPSTVAKAFKKIFSIIFIICNTFFSLIFAAANFLFGKIFSKLKKYFFSAIDFIAKQIKIKVESLFFEVEMQINDQRKKLNLQIALESLHFCFVDAINLDFLLELENLQIELSKKDKNKTIAKIEISNTEISKEEINDLKFKSTSNISIYFSLFDVNEIINVINQFKIQNAENNSQITNQNHKEFNLQLNIDIANIDFYIIKNNLPLLLLNIKPKSIHFNSNSETKIEVKFELKHLCHMTYKVINSFTTILTINKSNIDVIISPILVTLPSFLFKEIFAPECNDSFHSKLENQYQNIFFQNDTGMKIILALIQKENKNNFSIELNDNTPYKIKEENYEQNIKMNFNNKEYSFSISSLYSPILLDQDIIVRLKSENGINIIHFTSPYVVQNCLNYDISMAPNLKLIVDIESGKDKYIPCAIDFDITSDTCVSRTDEIDNQFLDFKSSEPIKLTDNNYLINSKPTNFYSSYFLSFESPKTICSINFFPYISITNFLPNNIKLRIQNITDMELKPGIINDISFLKDNKDKLKFIFYLRNFEMIGVITLKKKIENFVEEIPLYKNGDQAGNIVLKCSEIKVDKQKFYIMKIYCPLIIENCSKIPLSLQESKSNTYKFNNNFIFYSSKSLMNYEYSIKLPIVYDKLTNICTTKYQYVGNFSQVIPLQHKKNDSIFLLLLIEKQKNKYEEKLKIPSSIISIKPYLKVHSDVSETIIFSAMYKHGNNSQEFKNICNRGDTILFGSNEKGFFDVYVEGYQRCRSFNIFNIGSSVIRLDKATHTNSVLMFKLVVKKEDNIYCCNVSYPSFSSDVSIKNSLTNEFIYIRQQNQPQIKNFVYHTVIISPNDKVIYAKEQPFLYEELSSKYNCVVSFRSDSNKYLLSYEETHHSKRIGRTNYFYDVEKFDRDNRMITIYESSKSNDEDQHNKKPKINLSLRLTEVQASFIDNEMHEIFLVAIKNIVLKIDDKIKFSIDGFAVNDMYSASFSPVVLNGIQSPFLYVSISTKYPLNMLMFEDISIKIAPIQVFIDFQFIGDLIAIMKEIAECFSQLNLKSNLLFNIISVKKFSIKNIAAYATLACSVFRKYRFKHNDDFFFSLFKFPFSKMLSIDFNEVNKYNIEGSIVDLFKSIADCYRNQITFSKGLAIIVKLAIKTPKESKLFGDFLRNKNLIYNDSILEIPRRIPRSFPKGKICDIPVFINDDYPDTPTLFQYMLQKLFVFKHCNEQLKDLFFNKSEKTWMAIFDNLLFLFKNQKSTVITFNEIKSIKPRFKQLKIQSANNLITFTFETIDELQTVVNKVNFFMQKIKISKQYYALQ